MLKELFFASPAEAAPTTFEIASLIVQGLAVLVAVVASIIALSIAGRDRQTLLALSRRDRELERLRTELEYAVRLSANRNTGGSSDPDEAQRLGSEALALAGVVGTRWVPRQFERAMDGKSPDELAAMLDEPEEETPEWVKDKIESGLAVQRIVDEMYRD